MGILKLPDLNPVKFVKRDLSNGDLQPLSDRYNFIDTKRTFDSQIHYSQKWIKGRKIYLQTQMTGIDFLEIQLLDCNGTFINAYNYSDNIINYLIGPYVWEIRKYIIDTSAITIGQYFLIIKYRNTGESGFNYLISEPQEVVNELIDAVVIEYTNSFNFLDTFFKIETYPDWNMKFEFCIEGNIHESGPFVEEEVYEDQERNKKLLDSKPFPQFEFICGGMFGVPIWAGHRLNFIRSCDTVVVEGNQYTFEGAWAKNGENKYKLYEFTSKAFLVQNEYSREFGFIAGANSCDIPNLTVTATVGGANAVWTTANNNGLGFLYSLVEDDGTTQTPIIIDATIFGFSTVLSGLTTGTQYRFSIKTICQNGNYSAVVDQLFTVL